MKFWFPHRSRETVNLSRRSFIIGALAAPVIVRAASLMPVQALSTSWSAGIVYPQWIPVYINGESYWVPMW